jgi:hypothetical protein
MIPLYSSIKITSYYNRGMIIIPYLTIHNTFKRQTSMSPAGLEPTIPASEQPQTRDLDRVATGIGIESC